MKYLIRKEPILNKEKPWVVAEIRPDCFYVLGQYQNGAEAIAQFAKAAGNEYAP